MIGTRFDRAAGQAVRGCVGRERVAEEQHHRAEERRHQDGQADVAPELDRLAPRFAAASRHSRRRPSMAGEITRIISGIWK